MTTSKVLILDFGSQYTQLIARRVRELKVFCEILACNTPIEKIISFKPQAVILSGGPSSVYDKDAPPCDVKVLQMHLPMLGICYGMQWMSHQLGGKVTPGTVREYGPAQVGVVNTQSLFDGFPLKDISVWMSHGDHVDHLPQGFSSLAKSHNGLQAAIGNDETRMYGLQFHPEVAHTPQGTDILKNFLFHVAHLKPDWSMESFVADKIKEIKETVGQDRVLCAVSGGVDSSVMAALIHQAVGSQLDAFFIDNGLLRKNEGPRVVELFRKKS